MNKKKRKAMNAVNIDVELKKRKNAKGFERLILLYEKGSRKGGRRARSLRPEGPIKRTREPFAHATKSPSYF